MDITQAIEALGGRFAVTAITGVTRTAVAHWRAEGVFPPRHLIALRRAAAAKGIAIPDHLFRVPSAAPGDPHRAQADLTPPS